MALAEADRVIMKDGVLELGEHVFISDRDALAEHAQRTAIATGGGMGPGTIAALEALLASIAMLPGALLCSAADANGPGDRFADRHRSLAERFRIPFVRLRPPIEGGDWNDDLRARSETRGAKP
jgi:hypothetical protein